MVAMRISRGFSFPAEANVADDEDEDEEEEEEEEEAAALAAID